MPPLAVPDPRADHGDPIAGAHVVLWQELPAVGVLGRDWPAFLPLEAAGADVAADHVGEGGERESGDTSLMAPCCRGADVEADTCSLPPLR